jgi:hypothetical protein
MSGFLYLKKLHFFVCQRNGKIVVIVYICCNIIDNGMLHYLACLRTSLF